IDAAPRVVPAGSERPGSRVWTLSGDPQAQHAGAPWWHRGLTIVQILLWLGAIVLTAPVRRRPTPEPLSSEDEEVTA
ncbi:MAG: hypothetical protein ABWY50_03440, partial [Aeromicrobium sp.]